MYTLGKLLRRYGLDVRLPRSLMGRGLVDVAQTVDGKAANVVRINVK